MNFLEYKLLGINLLLSTFLAIFSYSYVDLNLTLSTLTPVLNIVAKLQILGYYLRPQATLFYSLLVIFLFINFLLNLVLISRKKVSTKYIFASSTLSTIIYIFSYPFLSSDLFNYMFDAKIVTLYNQNPYTNKPLDFPNDEWLRFMRWVHRYSPYGPLWIVYTLIPSVLGFGKFLITLITFKLFIGVFHILNSILIFKTLSKVNPKISLLGTAFYAINPLFLIEGVVNAHNDVVHAFFVLLSLYFFAKNQVLKSFTSIVVSSLIKYIALLSFIPLLTFKVFRLKFEHLVLLNLALYLMFTFVFSTFRISVPFISSGSIQTQFQPWYLFWSIPLVSFLTEKKCVLVLAIVICFSSLMRYLPFLYHGEWSKPGTTSFMTFITLSLPFITLLYLLGKNMYEKKYKK